MYLTGHTISKRMRVSLETYARDTLGLLTLGKPWSRPPISITASPSAAGAISPSFAAIDGRTTVPVCSTHPRLVAVHAGAGLHGLKECTLPSPYRPSVVPSVAWYWVAARWARSRTPALLPSSSSRCSRRHVHPTLALPRPLFALSVAVPRAQAVSSVRRCAPPWPPLRHGWLRRRRGRHLRRRCSGSV